MQCYKTPEEKMSYLLEQKTEYLQFKPALVDITEAPFDVQCDLELNLLRTQRELNIKHCLNENEESPQKSPKSPGTFPKLQINSKLNLVVDVFYQMMYEKHVNGRPIISGSPNEVADAISTIFKDKDGHDISPETVKTILKPSRIEKRPKGNSKLHFD